MESNDLYHWIMERVTTESNGIDLSNVKKEKETWNQQ